MDRDIVAVERKLIGDTKYKPYIMRRSEKILVDKLTPPMEMAYYEIMGAPSLYNNQGKMKSPKYGAEFFNISGLTVEEIEALRMEVKDRYDTWSRYMVRNGKDMEYSITCYIAQQNQTITQIKKRMQTRYGTVEKMFHNGLNEYVILAKW